jgi:hypothetical protein
MPKAQEGKEAGGDDTQLKADVKAFAAQLGLAAAGFSDGAFDDFAPEKASKRIGAAPKASSKKQGGDGERQKGDGEQPGGRQERRGGAASGGGGRQGREAGRPQQQQDRRQGYQQRDGDSGGRGGARPQQRSWQQHDGWEEEAAGPKIPNAKSILPRDEPTIWFEAASTLAPLAAATEEASPDVVQQRRRQAERLLLVEEQVGWRAGGVVVAACLGGCAACCPLPAARCPLCNAPPALPCSACSSATGASTPRRVAPRPAALLHTEGGCRRRRPDPLGFVEAPTAPHTGSLNATPGPALPLVGR